MSSQQPLAPRGTWHSWPSLLLEEGDAELGHLDLCSLQGFMLCNDTNHPTVVVRPGVRLLDLLPKLEASNLVLPTHTNYGGQTLIGAVQTASHGAGGRALHNYVRALTVLNGCCEVRRIVPGDHSFGAWLNGLGCLGVVLEMELEVCPAFNVQFTPVPRIDDVAEGLILLSDHELSELWYDPNCNVLWGWRRERVTDPVTTSWPEACQRPKSSDDCPVQGVYRAADCLMWYRPGKEPSQAMAKIPPTELSTISAKVIGDVEVYINPKDLQTALAACSTSKITGVIQIRYIEVIQLLALCRL